MENFIVTESPFLREVELAKGITIFFPIVDATIALGEILDLSLEEMQSDPKLWGEILSAAIVPITRSELLASLDRSELVKSNTLDGQEIIIGRQIIIDKNDDEIQIVTSQEINGVYYVAISNPLIPKLVAPQSQSPINPEQALSPYRPFRDDVTRDVFGALVLNGGMSHEDIMNTCAGVGNKKIAGWCNESLFQNLLLQNNIPRIEGTTARQSYIRHYSPKLNIKIRGTYDNLDELLVPDLNVIKQSLPPVRHAQFNDSGEEIVRLEDGRFIMIWQIRHGITALYNPATEEEFPGLNNPELLADDNFKYSKQMVVYSDRKHGERSYGHQKSTILLVLADGSLLQYKTGLETEGWTRIDLGQPIQKILTGRYVKFTKGSSRLDDKPGIRNAGSTKQENQVLVLLNNGDMMLDTRVGNGYEKVGENISNIFRSTEDKLVYIKQGKLFSSTLSCKRKIPEWNTVQEFGDEYGEIVYGIKRYSLIGAIKSDGSAVVIYKSPWSVPDTPDVVKPLSGKYREVHFVNNHVIFITADGRGIVVVLTHRRNAEPIYQMAPDGIAIMEGSFSSNGIILSYLYKHF
tara:strand:+ start:43067 stop:44794 length:1728 start_codon:yes stop_codon:yes gene_type:complete